MGFIKYSEGKITDVVKDNKENVVNEKDNKENVISKEEVKEAVKEYKKLKQSAGKENELN